MTSPEPSSTRLRVPVAAASKAQGSSFIAGHSGPDAIEAQDVKRRRTGDPARRRAGFSGSQEFGLEQLPPSHHFELQRWPVDD
jgi:hypothetical protein